MMVMRNSRKHAAEEGVDGDARWLEQKTAELIMFNRLFKAIGGNREYLPDDGDTPDLSG